MGKENLVLNQKKKIWFDKFPFFQNGFCLHFIDIDVIIFKKCNFFNFG